MDDLLRLIQTHLDGELTDEQSADLQARLRDDADALAVFVATCRLDLQLRDQLVADKSATQLESLIAVTRAADADANAPISAAPLSVAPPARRLVDFFTRPTPFSLSVALLFMGALITALAFTAAPIYERWSGDDGVAIGDAPTLIAGLTGVHDAVWADGQTSTRRGAHLVAGQRMELQRGMAEITFRNGVRCIASGPCQFVLDDAMRITLTRGKIAVDVSEIAKGFRVITPQGCVTDLGTRFGVQVHDSGREEVHVLQGVVEFAWERLPGSAQHRVRLVAGESFSVSPGQAAPQKGRSSPEQFALAMPTLEIKPVARWSFGSDEIGAGGGQAELSAGASPEADVLVLATDNALAMLPDADQMPPLDLGYTIALWVRPREIRSQNIIVRTNAAGPTVNFSHQLLMDAEGHFAHYTFAGGTHWIVGRTVAQVDQWYHVVITARRGGALRLFVNGIEDARGQVAIGPAWNAGDRFQVGGQATSLVEDAQVPAFSGAVRDVRIYESSFFNSVIEQMYRDALADQKPASDKPPAEGGSP